MSKLDFGEKLYVKDDGIVDCVLALKALPSDENSKAHLEELDQMPTLKKSKGSSESSSSPHDGLVLKQLPNHLSYAFLGANSTYLVIISAFLSSQEEKKLFEVLRNHKSALGWRISDI